MKKYKKILISGYYGFDNFGDETILSVLVKKLYEFDTQITVLSKNPIKTQREHAVHSTFYMCPCICLNHILKCDILISGGGSLLQDVTSVNSLLYYLFIISMALLFRKKVIIFAQGLGPINNKFAAMLTKFVLKRCSLVTVRDRKSKMILNKWGVDADLVCDPLFDLKLPEYKPENKVGIQLRKFKTLKFEFLTKLAEQINKEFSDKEIEIYSFQDSLDLEVCKRFETILKNINPQLKTSIVSNLTSQEVLDKFSKLEYLVGMRFHANLIAIRYGIKTLALSYDIKVEKLAEEAEFPCLVLGNEANLDELFEKMKQINPQTLINYSNSKNFDWSKFEGMIKN